MTIQQLKRKYLAKGFKLGMKRALLESDQWVRDYDRRLDDEDREYAERAQELAEIDLDYYLRDEVLEGVVGYVMEDSLRKVFGRPLAGQKNGIINYFKGKPISLIKQALMLEIREYPSEIDELIEGANEELGDMYYELGAHGVEFHEFTDEEIKAAIFDIINRAAKEFSMGTLPRSLRRAFGERY